MNAVAPPPNFVPTKPLHFKVNQNKLNKPNHNHNKRDDKMHSTNTASTATTRKKQHNNNNNNNNKSQNNSASPAGEYEHKPSRNQQPIDKCRGSLFEKLKTLKGLHILRHSLLPNDSTFEILEFYGDSVLYERISFFLMQTRRFMSPHLLTKLRSAVIQNRNLALCFETLNLVGLFEKGKAPTVMKGRADVVEAMLGELSEACTHTTSQSGIDSGLIRGALDELLAYICYSGEREYFLHHSLSDDVNSGSGSAGDYFVPFTKKDDPSINTVVSTPTTTASSSTLAPSLLAQQSAFPPVSLSTTSSLTSSSGSPPTYLTAGANSYQLMPHASTTTSPILSPSSAVSQLHQSPSVYSTSFAGPTSTAASSASSPYAYPLSSSPSTSSSPYLSPQHQHYHPHHQPQQPRSAPFLCSSSSIPTPTISVPLANNNNNNNPSNSHNHNHGGGSGAVLYSLSTSPTAQAHSAYAALSSSSSSQSHSVGPTITASPTRPSYFHSASSAGVAHSLDSAHSSSHVSYDINIPHTVADSSKNSAGNASSPVKGAAAAQRAYSPNNVHGRMTTEFNLLT
eukprot:TRINITY_DN1302_c0_g1_i1.p1 TRINITY_DN1302_c0_g1~~TRINITY_DN1302_c0_g1_i1.p1  ORF type:complete len:567 (+),score=116.39 TRINITY_DN1302_c0_g1_i1:353-2053(+)